MKLNDSPSSRIVEIGAGDCLRLPYIGASESRLARSRNRIAATSASHRAVTWARCSRPRTSAVLRSVSMRPNVAGRSPIASTSRFYLRSVERDIRIRASRTASSLSPRRRDSSRCSRERRRSLRPTRVRIIFVVIVSL